MPPTLTIFVGHKAVDLEKLKIPDGISVSAGYVPLVFHRSNTKKEKEDEEKQALMPKPNPPMLDEKSQKVADRIDAFLKQREKKVAKPAIDPID